MSPITGSEFAVTESKDSAPTSDLTCSRRGGCGVGSAAPIDRAAWLLASGGNDLLGEIATSDDDAAQSVLQLSRSLKPFVRVFLPAARFDPLRIHFE